VPHRRVDRVRQIRTKALSKTVPIVLSSFFHTPGCFQRFRMSDRRQIKNPGRRKGLCRPELLSRYGDAKHTYKTVRVTARSYALGSVQPPDITRTCALASAELIAHHSRLKFGCFSGFNYQRLPQFPLQLLRHPPPPRTSLTTNNSNTAPIVALAIAEIMPEPRWRPSCGRSQSPMKAPTIPMTRSPMIPNPVPCTICPASHPAMRPTNNMIRRLSPDMCILVSSSLIKPLSARLRGFLASQYDPLEAGRTLRISVAPVIEVQ